MRIAIYGGAGQIGGNKILLGEEGKVFLDFGVDFNAKNTYFSTFLQPRRFSLITDYVMTGVVPALKGLYRPETSPDNLRSEQPLIDAVIISHGHLDHYGHASLIRNDVPIYMGEGTKALVEAREEIRHGDAERLFGKDERRINLFRTGDRIEIAGMRIHPVHVDHSIPAAYGFVVEADGGAVAYTGDIRMHGPRRDMTYDFLEKCRRTGVDTLIVEGTRIKETENSTEDDVKAMLEKTVQESEGFLVSVVVGMTDFDRLKTILQVAEETGRLPAISLHHAHILKMIGSRKLRINVPKFDEDRLVAFLERRKSGKYSKSDYPKWMANLIESVPTVKEDTIKEDQKRFIMVLSRAEDIIELASIKPAPGSPFILSTSEPHSEEQILEMDKIKNWVSLLGLRMYHIHASGHAPGPHLLDIVKEIAPKKIIPIHSETPELFVHLLSREKINAKVIIPRKGECYEVF